MACKAFRDIRLRHLAVSTRQQDRWLELLKWTQLHWGQAHVLDLTLCTDRLKDLDLSMQARKEKEKEAEALAAAFSQHLAQSHHHQLPPQPALVEACRLLVTHRLTDLQTWPPWLAGVLARMPKLRVLHLWMSVTSLPVLSSLRHLILDCDEPRASTLASLPNLETLHVYLFNCGMRSFDLSAMQRLKWVCATNPTGATDFVLPPKCAVSWIQFGGGARFSPLLMKMPCTPQHVKRANYDFCGTHLQSVFERLPALQQLRLHIGYPRLQQPDLSRTVFSAAAGSFPRACCHQLTHLDLIFDTCQYEVVIPRWLELKQLKIEAWDLTLDLEDAVAFTATIARLAIACVRLHGDGLAKLKDCRLPLKQCSGRSMEKWWYLPDSDRSAWAGRFNCGLGFRCAACWDCVMAKPCQEDDMD